MAATKAGKCDQGSSMAEGTRDYAVGYGKPPTPSRFVKGRSGNPNGRPRGTGLAVLLRAALDEPVIVELGGRRRRMSKREAILATLTDGAMHADPRSQRLLVQLLLKLEGSGSALRDEDDEEDDGEDPREWLIREIHRIREARTYENAKALERLANEEATDRARRAASEYVQQGEIRITREAEYPTHPRGLLRP